MGLILRILPTTLSGRDEQLLVFIFIFKDSNWWVLQQKEGAHSPAPGHCRKTYRQVASGPPNVRSQVKILALTFVDCVSFTKFTAFLSVVCHLLMLTMVLNKIMGHAFAKVNKCPGSMDRHENTIWRKQAVFQYLEWWTFMNLRRCTKEGTGMLVGGSS